MATIHASETVMSQILGRMILIRPQSPKESLANVMQSERELVHSLPARTAHPTGFCLMALGRLSRENHLVHAQPTFLLLCRMEQKPNFGSDLCR
jgi:hypothetical protein